MKVLSAILILLSSIAYSQSKSKNLIVEDSDLKPFVLTLYDSDYSMAFTLRYVLTETELTITHIAELEGEKNSVIYKKKIKPNGTLKIVSNINLDSLSDYYENPCILDGSQISVDISKGEKVKRIHLSNYYQPEIGKAIELINSLTPKKYKIWYDKKGLLEAQERCK